MSLEGITCLLVWMCMCLCVCVSVHSISHMQLDPSVDFFCAHLWLNAQGPFVIEVIHIVSNSCFTGCCFLPPSTAEACSGHKPISLEYFFCSLTLVLGDCLVDIFTLKMIFNIVGTSYYLTFMSLTQCTHSLPCFTCSPPTPTTPGELCILMSALFQFKVQSLMQEF